MRIVVRFARLIVLAGLLISSAAVAQSIKNNADIDRSIAANVGDPAAFKSFLHSLQQAVQKHDASAVAAMISYPLTVNPRTSAAMRVKTPQAFVASYDKIVTQHIAEVISKQKYEALFVSYQGAMFGDGEVWIAGICKDKECNQTDIRIKTIQNTAGRK